MLGNLLAQQIEGVAIGKDVRLCVHPAFGINPDLQSFLFDQPNQNLHRRLGLIRLVHEFYGRTDVFGSLRRHALGLCFLGEILLLSLVGHELQAAVSFGDLLQRLAICRVAYQQPQLLHGRQRLGNAFQAGKKEVANREAA